jgi:Zn-dependent protease with chaperone function
MLFVSTATTETPGCDFFFFRFRFLFLLLLFIFYFLFYFYFFFVCFTAAAYRAAVDEPEQRVEALTQAAKGNFPELVQLLYLLPHTHHGSCIKN